MEVTIRSEEDAQKAYEDFAKETYTSIEAKSNDIASDAVVGATGPGGSDVGVGAALQLQSGARVA